MSIRPQFSNQTRGILLMIAAVFTFTVMDAIAKGLSLRLDTIQVVWARYTGQSVIVTLLILPRLRSTLRTRYPKLQLLRALLLLGATSFFFFAISRIGLAEATAIMDISPVLITLGAALFLGEKFGPRRAFGVAAALIGALIIIRPGSGVFSPAAILPLAAAVCYSGYTLATRFVGPNESIWTSLFYTGVIGSLLLSLVVPFVWITPSPGDAGLLLAVGLVGALAQLLMIRALSLAEASLLAPFTYAGLMFATVWGALFYGEYPDAMTWLGGFVIVVAGLYVWLRETRDDRQVQAAE
jgi:drug/metabolite transporter (DMT)-like permease